MANRQIIVRRRLSKETRIQDRIIWDDSISTAARFALIAMLSLPDTWDYSVRGMAVKLRVSKDTMGKYMQELEKAGYLKRAQLRGERGAFGKSQYILTDTKGDFGEGPGQPCPDLPDTVPSDPDLSDPKKSPQKKRTQEEKTNQQDPPKAPKGARRSKYALQEEAKPLLRAYVGQDNQLARKLADFIQLREQLRAVNSAVAIQALLNKLDKLSGGDRDLKFQLIDEAVANSWKSVFPLKGPKGGPPGGDGDRRTAEREEVPTW